MHRASELARRALSPIALLGALCVVVVGMGGAAAATGAAFVLGHDNRATHMSTLTSTTGVPLALRAAEGAPPLRVDSDVRVRHLNADLLDGQSARGIAAAARRGLMTTWQVLVNGDGSTSISHSGLSVARNSAGDYTVVWAGFGGPALPYCAGIGRAGVVLTQSADADGSGSLRINFSGVDTRFDCLLVGLAS
jgi:hypothetical protein